MSQTIQFKNEQKFEHLEDKMHKWLINTRKDA